MNRRFALIQALVSLVALAAVIWWASKQDAPTLPNTAASHAWMAGALALYTVATLMRGERWHRILYLTGVKSTRVDAYALTTVGYMGNNVLPLRAGEVVRVYVASRRTANTTRTSMMPSDSASRTRSLTTVPATSRFPAPVRPDMSTTRNTSPARAGSTLLPM